MIAHRPLQAGVVAVKSEQLQAKAGGAVPQEPFEAFLVSSAAAGPGSSGEMLEDEKFGITGLAIGSSGPATSMPGVLIAGHLGLRP